MQDKPYAELELSETAHRVLLKAASSGKHVKVEHMAVLCGIQGQRFTKGIDCANTICGKLNIAKTMGKKSIRIERDDAVFLLYNVNAMELPETGLWFAEVLYAKYVLGIENYRAAAAETAAAINQLRKSLRCIVDELTAAENAEGA